MTIWTIWTNQNTQLVGTTVVPPDTPIAILDTDLAMALEAPIDYHCLPTGIPNVAVQTCIEDDGSIVNFISSITPLTRDSELTTSFRLRDAYLEKYGILPLHETFCSTGAPVRL